MQKSEQRAEWIEACHCEIAVHQDGKKYIIIKGIWCFQIKTEDVKIKSYKTHYCADESGVLKN